jgi:lipopolysaccharide biosynthesis regulator YciM
LYELGQDFLKAGLLDRAEDVFKKLEGGVHALDALRHQLDIFVLEKDWEAAITVAQRLEKLGNPSQKADTAHYYCELALNAMLRKEVDQARQYLNQALAMNRKAVRASQLLGDLAAQAGDDAAAIEHWRRIEQQNVAYLPVVAERLLKACQRLGRLEDGIGLIKDYLARQPSADLFHILFNVVAENQGWAAAEALAAEALPAEALPACAGVTPSRSRASALTRSGSASAAIARRTRARTWTRRRSSVRTHRPRGIRAAR